MVLKGANAPCCLLQTSAYLLAYRYGPCEAESLKERMKRAVALLGEKEVQNIMEQEGKIEVSSLLCLLKLSLWHL